LRCLQRDTVGRETVARDRHLRDDRDIRIDFACSEERLLDLLDVGECLEKKDIRATFFQTCELLGENLPSLR
jgi:hypothetical protein